MIAQAKDWNPGAYARFRGLRLRPALDLLAQVGDLPKGDVIDLGCGDGAAAEALGLRFAGRRVVGVDSSPAMLDKAKGYGAKIRADIATWHPETPPALIFSNAVLHWLPDHARLLPRLAGLLAQGGVLAVQMPRQFLAPSHRFLRDIAVAMFPDRFDFGHRFLAAGRTFAAGCRTRRAGSARAWHHAGAGCRSSGNSDHEGVSCRRYGLSRTV